MNFELLLPELNLLVFAVAVIILDLLTEKKAILAGVSIAGLLVSAALAVSMWGQDAAVTLNNMLIRDEFALFFDLIFLVTAGLVILASSNYVKKMAKFQGEYYALILLATIGMMLMASTGELISIYVSLELASISLYVLTTFLKDNKSTEAGLKYLLLGAISSAMLLYGMALIFGLTGQTHLANIAASLRSLSLSGILASPALVLGLVLIVAGLGFKIAAVPFQMWVPDVYEGAPTPITAFLSVASKAAGFALILRIFYTAFGPATGIDLGWGMLFAVLAAVTMTVGNIVALVQTNIKRMLGYSSIAQAGYLMVGLAAVGLSHNNESLGRSGILFFLASYTFTNLAAFIAIIAISNKINSDNIDDYAGMGKRSPLIALALTLALVSLIGLPPTAGLIAKVYLFNSAVSQGLVWLVIIAVLNSVISAYYYLRVPKVMWLGTPASEEKVPSSSALKTALSLSCLGILLLGLIPSGIVKLAEAAAKKLFS